MMILIRCGSNLQDIVAISCTVGSIRVDVNGQTLTDYIPTQVVRQRNDSTVFLAIVWALSLVLS
jgi:hypothetical protein